MYVCSLISLKVILGSKKHRQETYGYPTRKEYRTEKMSSIENSKSSHTNMKVKFFNRLLKGA